MHKILCCSLIAELKLNFIGYHGGDWVWARLWQPS